MFWVLAYAASIVAANVLISLVGFVPVGFGLMAPAGVYAAGISFWLHAQGARARVTLVAAPDAVAEQADLWGAVS